VVFSAIRVVTPDILQIPEHAMQSFEKMTGLSVVVHDLASNLWPFLPPERFRHRSSFCAAVKATHDWACMDFEVTRLREEILRFPEGRYHVCHAGLMEWVVPAFLNDRLAWIFFAGQRTPSGIFRENFRDVRRSTIPHQKVDPPPVDEENAKNILEALRQLRARLMEWHQGAATSFLRKASWDDGAPVDHLSTRRLQIQRFIYERHTGDAAVRDLALELRLGESRTMHLVKEIFGCSYIKLLNDMRLRTAASLLRETSVPIVEVCFGSGFQDLSHFHRLFQKRFGLTPLRYRRVPSV
jgi:AraC-like DNA-binding protein